MKNRPIGAPNSVARYLQDNTFGDNKWLVLERVNGALVMKAGQTSYLGAYRYWSPEKLLVDVENCWIVLGRDNEAGTSECKELTRCSNIDGSLKAHLLERVRNANIPPKDGQGPIVWDLWHDQNPLTTRTFTNREEAYKAFNDVMAFGTGGMQ